MAAAIPDAGLPAPTSNESLYLAALLDEIRLLRQALAARPELPAGEVELREPSPVENKSASKTASRKRS